MYLWGNVKGRWNGGRDSVKPTCRTYRKAVRMAWIVHGIWGADTSVFRSFNKVEAEFLAPAGAYDRIESSVPPKKPEL